MASPRKPNPLGDLLLQLLTERGLSQAAFCKQVGLRPSNLSAIRLRGPTRLPKAIDVNAWAKALGLTASERAALQRAAELAWSPAGIQRVLSRKPKPTQH